MTVKFRNGHAELECDQQLGSAHRSKTDQPVFRKSKGHTDATGLKASNSAWACSAQKRSGSTWLGRACRWRAWPPFPMGKRPDPTTAVPTTSVRTNVQLVVMR